jgi:hypothetical protein
LTPIIPIQAYVHASIQTLSTYVGGAMLPIWVHETYPYPFTNGKYAWASNMDSNEFQFYIFVIGLSSITKKGEI